MEVFKIFCTVVNFCLKCSSVNISGHVSVDTIRVNFTECTKFSEYSGQSLTIKSGNGIVSFKKRCCNGAISIYYDKDLPTTTRLSTEVMNSTVTSTESIRLSLISKEESVDFWVTPIIVPIITGLTLLIASLVLLFAIRARRQRRNGSKNATANVIDTSLFASSAVYMEQHRNNMPDVLHNTTDALDNNTFPRLASSGNKTDQKNSTMPCSYRYLLNEKVTTQTLPHSSKRKLDRDIEDLLSCSNIQVIMGRKDELPVIRKNSLPEIRTQKEKISNEKPLLQKKSQDVRPPLPRKPVNNEVQSLPESVDDKPPLPQKPAKGKLPLPQTPANSKPPLPQKPPNIKPPLPQKQPNIKSPLLQNPANSKKHLPEKLFNSQLSLLVTHTNDKRTSPSKSKRPQKPISPPLPCGFTKDCKKTKYKKHDHGRIPNEFKELIHQSQSESDNEDEEGYLKINGEMTTLENTTQRHDNRHIIDNKPTGIKGLLAIKPKTIENVYDESEMHSYIDIL